MPSPPNDGAARPRVAVVGHVEWVDFISVPHLPRAGEVLHAPAGFTRAAGGGGVAASVLAAHGAEVDFFCALGRDEHGEAAAAELAGRGVRPQIAWRDQPTRRAVTMLEGGGERTIVTIGERLDPHSTDALDWDLLKTCAGAYFTAGDPGALALARQAGVLVCSPRAHRAFRAGGPVVDALVFSAEDRDECEWARQLGSQARVLVATEAAHGGRWWSERESAAAGRWSAVPLPGVPCDSYGCGDSFAAGVSFGLAGGDSIADAAALGAHWAARCLTQAGAP
jgi:ribokinase